MVLNIKLFLMNFVNSNVVKNVLSQEKYLISNDLHNVLLTSKLENSTNIISKNNGIYIVAVRLLNQENRTIIYNYIYYPSIFIETLVAFLLFRNINSLRFNQ